MSPSNRAYREVGTRWLTRVPETWDVVRLRYLCDIGTGSGDTQDADPDGDYPFYVRSPNPLRSETFSFNTEAVLTAGDGAVGEVFHHVKGKFHAHQRVYVLSNFKHIDPRYFYYYFSTYFRQMAQDGSARTTVDSVRRWMLTDMPVVVPPTVEQSAIANYLDDESARIDILIEEQQRLGTLLRERLAAFIDAEFQSAAGKRDIFARWALRKLNRPAIAGNGIITAYRDGTVTLRSNRREEGYTLSDLEQGYQGIVSGDLVFHALDGFAGAVGVSDSVGNATPVYHVCRPREGDDVEYLALLLRYLGTSGFLAVQAPNVRQRSVDFRNWGTFGRVPLALPPVQVQRDFVSRLKEYSARIDTLIAESERFIELARERRAALITAAVTGQIDVREMAA